MALLGKEKQHTVINPEKFKDEEDLQKRSTKKVKEGEHIFSPLSSQPLDYSDVILLQQNEGEVKKSYRNKVLGNTDHSLTDTEEVDEDADQEADGNEEEERMKGDKAGSKKWKQF
ncbi:hypothetical protein RYX36_002907 [Vicia faba]